MKAHIETDQEYINRTTRIDMDYIHSTLQECLSAIKYYTSGFGDGGNIDIYMINESIALVEKHRDKCIEDIQV